MKNFIYLFILLIYNFNIIAQEDNLIYVMIECKHESLYNFKKEVSKDKNHYFSSIKILKDKYKNRGFNNKQISNKKGDDIVFFEKEPREKNFFEFQSYMKPKKMLKIDSLKLYSIKDVSRNIKEIKKIWGNYKYSIVFIENKNSNYLLWKMKPIYSE